MTRSDLCFKKKMDATRLSAIPVVFWGPSHCLQLRNLERGLVATFPPKGSSGWGARKEDFPVLVQSSLPAEGTSSYSYLEGPFQVYQRFSLDHTPPEGRAGSALWSQHLAQGSEGRRWLVDAR